MDAMEKKDKTLNVPHLRFPEFSGEWEYHELQGIAPNISSGKDKPNNEGTVVLYGSTGIMGHTTTESYNSEIVIVARVGANAGQLQLVDIPCGVTDNALVVDAKSWNKYVFFYLQHFNLNKLVFGSGQPLITGGMLKKIKIWTGNNVERNKIVHLLSLMEERIDTQRKIIEDLKKLKDAIDNSLHNNINEFQLFSFNELGNDYSGLTGKSSEDFGSGLPYISYLNVFRNDIITDESFDYVKVSKTEKQNVVSYGDLLFTLSSETPSEVGIGAIYLGKTNPIYLNSFCFGVHLSNQENIYGPYLAYFVTSQYFRKTILPFAQGSTRYNLMKSDFMKHKFRFPNMVTQKAIYNALHTLSKKIQNEEVCLNKYTEQKQYLLARLFI